MKTLTLLPEDERLRQETSASRQPIPHTCFEARDIQIANRAQEALQVIWLSNLVHKSGVNT